MKIALCPADLGGCGWYRMILPGIELRRRGHDVAFIGQPSDARLRQSDVVILQRQHSDRSLKLARELRGRGVRVLHEFDDNFHFVPSANPNAKMYGSGRPATKGFEAICREVDGLIVSTAALADDYACFNDRVHVAQNAVADRHVEGFAPPAFTGEPKRPGQIRIGWAGSDTHRGDFATIVPAIATVLERAPHVRMIFIGADMRTMLPEKLWPRAEFIPAAYTDAAATLEGIGADDGPFGPYRYYELLERADLDIAVAPLEHQHFNRAKSWIKAIEYGMLGIPSVLEHFGPYRDFVMERHSALPVTLTAETKRHWIDGLMALVDSPDLRRSIAIGAVDNVRAEHRLSRRIHQWEAILDQYATGRGIHALTYALRGGIGDQLCALAAAQSDLDAHPNVRFHLDAHPAIVELMPSRYDDRTCAAAETDGAIKLDIIDIVERPGRTFEHPHAHPVDLFAKSLGFVRADPAEISADADAPAYDYVIAPFTSDRAQRGMPESLLAQLVDALNRDAASRIAIVGTATDYANYDEHELAQISGEVSFVVDASTRYVAGLFRNARNAVITVDSFPNRLAHAARIPHHVLLCSNVVPAIWGSHPKAHLLYAAPREWTVDAIAALAREAAPRRERSDRHLVGA